MQRTVSAAVQVLRPATLLRPVDVVRRSIRALLVRSQLRGDLLGRLPRRSARLLRPVRPLRQLHRRIRQRILRWRWRWRWLHQLWRPWRRRVAVRGGIRPGHVVAAAEPEAGTPRRPTPQDSPAVTGQRRPFTTSDRTARPRRSSPVRLEAVRWAFSAWPFRAAVRRPRRLS